MGIVLSVGEPPWIVKSPDASNDAQPLPFSGVSDPQNVPRNHVEHGKTPQELD